MIQIRTYWCSISHIRSINGNVSGNFTNVFIMIDGIWSSHTFLKYTSKQVIKSSKGVYTRMINNDLFYTLSYIRTSSLDPRGGKQNSFTTPLSVPIFNASGIIESTRPSFYLHF